MNLKHLKNLFQTRSQTLELVQDASSDRVSSTVNRSVQIRNIIGFWILGVGNVYCYLILLSAAHDILNKDFLHPRGVGENISDFVRNTSSSSNDSYPQYDCNALSTGVVLLAEIIPHLITKLILPFCPIPTVCGMIIVFTMMTASLLLIGFSYQVWTTFLSIVGIAIPTSLGEVILIQYSSMFFGKNEMVAWCAGSGGGAILSALLYAALTTAGLSTRLTLLIMLIFPALMILAFLFIIIHPNKVSINPFKRESQSKTYEPIQNYNNLQSSLKREVYDKLAEVTFTRKLKQIKSLLSFTVPLSIVFFVEYFINLGLYELIYFPGIWLKQSEQYRWFLTDYQMGVFVSRTLGSFLLCHKYWIIPILQLINLAIFLLHIFFKFIPSIWIMLVLMFYEGLLGGSAFVNIFSNVLEKVSSQDLQFAISVVATGDSLGMCIAGFVALPVHDYICNHLR